MGRGVVKWTCALVLAGWLMLGWRAGDLRFGTLSITAYADSIHQVDTPDVLPGR